MDNTLVLLILILFISIIYLINVFFSLHDRVIFYEEMEENNVYQVYLDNGTFPLTINKVYNNELTMYADITFDYVKFYRIPSPLIFNFVRKSDEYDYDTIWKELKKYSNITND